MATTTKLTRIAPISDEKAERTLAEALRGRGGAITRADAVALTGLGVDTTEAALRSMLRQYRSHLAVTDEGELVYRFDPSMARRDALTLADRLRAMGEVAWRAFTIVFKIAISVALVGFVAMIVAMAVALLFMRNGDDRDDRRDDGGGGFGFPWIWYWMMPDLAPPQRDRYGRRRLAEGPKKRFYQSVFDFVFGPPTKGNDPLAGDRAVVAYLREKNGRITTTDLVALTGMSYEEADQEATRLLAAYDGEPEITDEGTIVYAFPELRRTAGELAPTATWTYDWQRTRDVGPLTGNTDGSNTAIAVMNSVILLGAPTVVPTFLARIGALTPELLMLAAGAPMAYAATFFAVPAARAWRRARKARRLAREALRARVIEAVILRRGAAFEPEALVRQIAQAGKASADAVRAELERLLKELDGDVTTSESGATLYAFPRVAEELVVVERVRALAPAAEREAGQVEFSSDEPDPALPEGPRLVALPSGTRGSN